jgi:hypothetical protein
LDASIWLPRGEVGGGRAARLPRAWLIAAARGSVEGAERFRANFARMLDFSGGLCVPWGDLETKCPGAAVTARGVTQKGLASMCWKPNKVRGDLERRAERAVVLQVLRDDHEERWSRVELDGELAYFEGEVVDGAVADLHGEGLVHLENGVVWASAAARRLDDLDLIGV